MVHTYHLITITSNTMITMTTMIITHINYILHIRYYYDCHYVVHITIGTFSTVIIIIVTITILYASNHSPSFCRPYGFHKFLWHGMAGENPSLLSISLLLRYMFFFYLFVYSCTWLFLISNIHFIVHQALNTILLTLDITNSNCSSWVQEFINY